MVVFAHKIFALRTEANPKLICLVDSHLIDLHPFWWWNLCDKTEGKQQYSLLLYLFPVFGVNISSPVEFIRCAIKIYLSTFYSHNEWMRAVFPANELYVPYHLAVMNVRMRLTWKIGSTCESRSDRKIGILFNANQIEAATSNHHHHCHRDWLWWIPFVKTLFSSEKGGKRDKFP